MSLIDITNEVQRNFINDFMQISGINPFNLNWISNTALECKDPYLFQMVDRFNQGKTTVIPFKNNTKILWLILQSHEKLLQQHADEITHFISKSYAKFYSGKFYFNNDRGAGKWGAQLFSSGYKYFATDIQSEHKIWNKLDLWIGLDDQRPTINPDELKHNAFILRNQFFQALSLQHWEEAEKIVDLLQRDHLISDENCKFLRIQLFSTMGRWQDIWDSEDYDLLTGLNSLPRRVQIALLSAFYYSVLSNQDLENDIQGTLRDFAQQKSRLGVLLRSQIGLEEDPVLLVFSLDAALSQEKEKLLRYLEKTNDGFVRGCIHKLLNEIKPENEEEKKKVSNEECIAKANHHFKMNEYEDAYLILLDCEPSIEKVKLLNGIALMTEDEEIIHSAYNEYSQLTSNEQQEINSDPASKGWIAYVLRCKNGITDLNNENVKTLPANWIDWFYRLNNQLYSIDELHEMLTNMDENENNIPSSIKLREQLTEQLLTISIETVPLDQKSLIIQAIPMFIGELLLEKNFPNPVSQEMYEYARIALTTYGKVNANNLGLLLRLTEGVLLLDITVVNSLWEQFEIWLSMIPSEKISPYVLESLLLFEEYGLQDEKLTSVWNHWLASLSDRFIHKNSDERMEWYNLGLRIKGDSALLNHLKQKDEEIDDENLINSLGSKTITIYSLREKSANRAARKIEEMNQNLKVRVCTSDRLTVEAKSYAQHSDIVIIVTTCISHALTYGIMPHIRGDIIYPRSSGEIGIIQALEEYSNDKNGIKNVS